MKTIRLQLMVVALCILSGAAERNTVSIDALIRQSKFAEAERQIQQLLVRNPNDSRALALLGGLRRKEGKYFEAEKAFRAALETNPKSPEGLEGLGSLYADEGKVADALPLYESLHAISPGSAKVVTQLASLYLQAGEFDRSLKMAQSIPVASRPDKVFPIMIGDYIGLKRDDEIQKLVPEILRRAPAHPELVPQLANVFIQGGMVGDAAELLKLAQTRMKPTAALLTALANVQAKSGHREQAQATINQALVLDANYGDALWGAARLAGGAGEWKQAVAFLQRMLKTNPPRAEVLQSLVFASMQIHDLQLAHDAALDLQDLQPDSLDGVLVMSAVLIEGLHWGEAEALVKKALQRYPDNKRLQYAAGMAEFKLGKIDDAEPYLRAALGQGEADADVRYTLGQIAAQRGDVAAATEQMESALALNPKKPEVLFSLGQFYLQLNQVDKAKTMLERAVTLAPDNAQNHYQLAMAYRRSGLNAEAQEQMKLFQQLSVRHVPEPTGDAASAPR